MRVLTACISIAISVAAQTAPAVANPIIVFNTAVDGNGNVLPRRTIDPHYQLVHSPKGPGPAFVMDPTFLRRHDDGPWIGNNKKSKWIGPVANERHYRKGGNFDYRTTFDLTGLDPATAVLKGKWTSDNNATIYLNGAATSNTTPGNAYIKFHHFSVTSGFVKGVNKLDFVVTNILNKQVPTNPTGLRVVFTTATANSDANDNGNSARP